MSKIEFKYNGICKECKSNKLILDAKTDYIICLECGLIQNYNYYGVYDMPETI